MVLGLRVLCLLWPSDGYYYHSYKTDYALVLLSLSLVLLLVLLTWWFGFVNLRLGRPWSLLLLVELQVRIVTLLWPREGFRSSSGMVHRIVRIYIRWRLLTSDFAAQALPILSRRVLSDICTTIYHR